MQKTVLLPDFGVTIKKIRANNSPPHRHRYFEMIYVLDGSGKHIINGNHFDYTRRNLFLLHPDDLHTFKIVAPTELCIIDFTGSFFSFIGSLDKNQYPFMLFFEQMEYVFHNHYRIKGNIIMDAADQQWTETLIQRLLWEKQQQGDTRELMLENIVFLLTQLVATYIRKEAVFSLKTRHAGKLVQDIINYIHRNIYEKEALKIENIAAHFFKSKDHISLYFKQQTGITLKEYMLTYKLELVKTRLLYSYLTIGSIAAELDFTDESHLNKLFKRKYSVTANGYRKKFMA